MGAFIIELNCCLIKKHETFVDILFLQTKSHQNFDAKAYQIVSYQRN